MSSRRNDLLAVHWVLEPLLWLAGQGVLWCCPSRRTRSRHRWTRATSCTALRAAGTVSRTTTPVSASVLVRRKTLEAAETLQGGTRTSAGRRPSTLNPSGLMKSLRPSIEAALRFKPQTCWYGSTACSTVRPPRVPPALSHGRPAPAPYHARHGSLS
jgi:hypothetical protein